MTHSVTHPVHAVDHFLGLLFGTTVGARVSDPSSQKRGMGTRQDGDFDLGRITRLWREFGPAPTWNYVNRALPNANRFKVNALGQSARRSVLWHDACGGVWEPAEDFSWKWSRAGLKGIRKEQRDRGDDGPRCYYSDAEAHRLGAPKIQRIAHCTSSTPGLNRSNDETGTQEEPPRTPIRVDLRFRQDCSRPLCQTKELFYGRCGLATTTARRPN
jgi:hypothetical protein